MGTAYHNNKTAVDLGVAPPLAYGDLVQVRPDYNAKWGGSIMVVHVVTPKGYILGMTVPEKGAVWFWADQSGVISLDAGMGMKGYLPDYVPGPMEGGS